MCVKTYTHTGDKIITHTPVYPPFYNVILENGRRLVNSELKLINGYYTIDFEGLLEKIKPKKHYFTSNIKDSYPEFDMSVKMMLLCNPHNPSGRVWTKEELLRIGEICLQNNMIIVSDDIHSDVIYKNYKYIPIASLSEELQNNTITCISPGKTFSMTGLATSIIIIPNRRLREEFNKTLITLELEDGNVFGIAAAEKAYMYGEEWLEQLLDYLQGNLDFITDYCEKYIGKIKLIKPQGTYLVWLDCSQLELKGIDLMDFFVNKARIGVNPGSTFGNNSDQFVRLNIGCSRIVLEEAMKRLRAAVEAKE